MQEVLDLLISGSKSEIVTKNNTNLFRPADFSFKEPSSRKFRDLTGWVAEIDFKDTLNGILEDWRSKL
jgi:nucleoside-diphosphate-sugar epimerase